MKYEHPQLINDLAGRYALGTLQGPARRRMERLSQSNPAVLTAIHRWEERLAGLADLADPVEPPEKVWAHTHEKISLTGRAAQRAQSRWWRNRTWLAIAAGIVALVLALNWLILRSPPASELIATITDEQKSQLWSIEASVGRDKLLISASAGLALDAARAYELWALPEAGGAPVSLGLMPLSGAHAVPLTSAQRRALAGARQVAVSLEPPGGSPTGAPTGPVLFVADIASTELRNDAV